MNNKLKKEKMNYSGIINEEVKMKNIVKDTLPIYASVVQIILIFLAVICPLYSFTNVFGFKIDYIVISLVVIASIIVEYIAFRLLKNYDVSIFSIIIIGIYCGVVIFTYKKLISGVLYVVEDYLELFNFNYNTDYILYTSVAEDAAENISLLVIIMAILMSFIITYVVLVKMNRLLYVLITIVWLILGYVVGLEPNYKLFLVYVFVSTVILSVEQFGDKTDIQKYGKDYTKNQIVLRELANVKMKCVVLIFIAVFFIIFNLCFSKKSYEESTYLRNINAQAKSSVNNIFNKDLDITDAFDREVGGENPSNLSNIIGKTTVLNNGKIDENGNARFYNKNVFTVVSNEVSDTLYLKQFIGLEYDGGWITNKTFSYNFEKLSMWDNEIKYSLNNSFDKIKDMIKYDLISIKNFDGKGHLIPTASNEDYVMIKNGMVNYKNKVNVSCGYELEFQKNYYDIDSLSVSTIVSDEETMNIYKGVPSKLVKTIEKIKPEIDAYIKKILDKEYGSNYNEQNVNKVTVRAVIDYFNDNFKYTLTPGKVPNDKDPIEYFLLDNKKGYCMYYAAAATAILRYYGIPTRYVEGYVINSRDCENAKRVEAKEYVNKLGEYNDSFYKFKEEALYEYNIKDTNGHAWVEIYMPGIGWIPTEVTTSNIIESFQDEEMIKEVEEEGEEQKNKDKENDVAATISPTIAPSSTTKPKVYEPIVVDYDKNKSEISKERLGIIICISVVGILIICIIIVMCKKILHIVKNLNYDKKLKETDKISYACKMIIYILKKNNICFDAKKGYKEFANSIAKKYNAYNIEQINQLVDIMLIHNFSKGKISATYEKEIVDFYNCILQEYIENARGLERLRRVKECNVDNYIQKVL